MMPIVRVRRADVGTRKKIAKRKCAVKQTLYNFRTENVGSILG